MTKTKKVEKVIKKAVVKPAKEKKTIIAKPAVTTPVASLTAPIFPFYNGSRVIKIINETEPGHKLCKMSDGTTVHVPNELFK